MFPGYGAIPLFFTAVAIVSNNPLKTSGALLARLQLTLDGPSVELVR